jgi:hypothetical protein
MNNYEKKDKKEVVKISTIFIAEVCLILTTLLFTMNADVGRVWHVIIGLLSMSAVLYFGLLSIESVSVSRENVRVTDKANKVIDTVINMDKTASDIHEIYEDSMKRNEAAMKGIVQALGILREDNKNLITLLTTPPETPKKKK